MASYLQIENISKSYGPKVLFDHISFHVNEGDKIALIAPNGTGKTSLMRILAGKDKSDSGGKILFLKDIRIAFLEQEYAFDPEACVLDQVLRDSTEWTASLDEEGRAAYELRVRQLLTSFHLGDFGKRMKELSGGEVKRVALTRLLASEADFLIMDPDHGRAHQPPGHRRHRVPGGVSGPLSLHPADGYPRPVFPGSRVQHRDGNGPRGHLHLSWGLRELPGKAAGTPRQLQCGDRENQQYPPARAGMDPRFSLRQDGQGEIPQECLPGAEGALGTGVSQPSWS